MDVLVVSAIARGIELLGVAVLLVGLVVASTQAHRNWSAHRRVDAYHKFRADLGRSILLGLEILIVADIIRTVAFQPTRDSLIALAAVVLIRTFLSFALEIEISGELPWRRTARVPHEAEPDQDPPDRSSTS